MMLRLLHSLFLRIGTSLENRQLVFVRQTLGVQATPQSQFWPWLYSQTFPPYLGYASNCSYVMYKDTVTGKGGHVTFIIQEAKNEYYFRNDKTQFSLSSKGWKFCQQESNTVQRQRQVDFLLLLRGSKLKIPSKSLRWHLLRNALQCSNQVEQPLSMPSDFYFLQFLYMEISSSIPWRQSI